MLQTSGNTDSRFTERQGLPSIATAAVNTMKFVQESVYLDRQLDSLSKDRQLDSLSNSALTQIQ